MAQWIKRTYDIIVLQVELVDPPGPSGDVCFTLQYKIDGTLHSDPPRYETLEVMRLSPTYSHARNAKGDRQPIRLPPDLLEWLRDWLDQERKERGSEQGEQAEAVPRPLWVHLVKPYGVLRIVPWERLLGEALGTPILMLPDFIFPPPREAAGVLDVVLCGTAPLGSDIWSTRDAVQLAVQAIIEARRSRTRVHVFADRELSDILRDHWHGQGWLDNEVLVYEHASERFVPEEASPRLVNRKGTLRSPWLVWMRDALRDIAVDVVHFACHGYLARDRGAVLFAESPVQRTDFFHPVGAVELQTFLTQVGAWSTVLTSLRDDYSEVGLRFLADEIAQSRPGPLMMHSMALDRNGAALRDGYRFLYADALGEVPSSTALFIYCQPYLVRDSIVGARPAQPRRDWAPSLSEMALGDADRELAVQPADSPQTDRLYDRGEQVASWVASTERFAEQVQLDLQQLTREDVLPTQHRELHTRVTAEMLSTLRDAVAEAALADFDEPEDPDAVGSTAAGT